MDVLPTIEKASLLRLIQSIPTLPESGRSGRTAQSLEAQTSVEDGGYLAERQIRYGRCSGLILTELGPARGSAMFLDLSRDTQREMKQRSD